LLICPGKSPTECCFTARHPYTLRITLRIPSRIPTDCGGREAERALTQAIVAEKGTDAWFYMSTEDLLPEKYKSMADSLRKGTDTMDVWFDSGSSWASVVNQREGLRLPVRVDVDATDLRLHPVVPSSLPRAVRDYGYEKGLLRDRVRVRA